MLLEKYYEEYIDSLDKNEGPKLKINNVTKKIADLSDEDYSSREYQERLTSDIRATLKQNGGDGRTYSTAQKQLMIWYNYFFLSKSKPVTHMRALEKLDFSKLQLPEPLERLIDAIVKKIEE
jgi:putative ATP-dependent endonuclease of the OLD family